MQRLIFEENMNAEDLMSLLNDPSGRDLVLLSSRRAMTWDDILDLPLPSGMGARRVWYALQSFRSATAVTTPFAMGDVQRPWYGMTLELSEMVARIGRECHRESASWKMFERASEQHFLMNMRVSDALASARLDGLEVTAEEVRSLLRYEQTPKTDAEKVVKNAHAAADALPGLVGEPFSVELLRHLGEMVSGGVDVEAHAPQSVFPAEPPFQGRRQRGRGPGREEGPDLHGHGLPAHDDGEDPDLVQLPCVFSRETREHFQ